MVEKKVRRVFSESFKKGKVKLVQTGKVSISQISRTYGVSRGAIYKWMVKYTTLPKYEKVVVETDSDFIKLLETTKKKENLERLVGKQQVRLDYYEELLILVNEHLGEDVEKKFLKK